MPGLFHLLRKLSLNRRGVFAYTCNDVPKDSSIQGGITLKSKKKLKLTILAAVMLAGATTTLQAESVREQSKAAAQLKEYIGSESDEVSVPDDYTVIKTGNLIVGEKGKDMHFISENGRYVFTGRVIDVWEKKEIRSVADIKSTEGKIDLKKMGFTPDLLNAFVIGQGNKKEVNIFIDPLCEFCNKLIKESQEIAASTNEYQFNFIVVPALGSDSHRLASAFFCSTDSTDKKVKALLSGKIDSLEQPPTCDKRRYDMTLYAATSAEVTGVPYLIHPDGTPTAGVPTNFMYWLEGKGKK